MINSNLKLPRTNGKSTVKDSHTKAGPICIASNNYFFGEKSTSHAANSQEKSVPFICFYFIGFQHISGLQMWNLWFDSAGNRMLMLYMLKSVRKYSAL